MASSLGGLSFVKDQALEIVGQIGGDEFGLGAGQADGLDEQTEAVLLVGQMYLLFGVLVPSIGKKSTERILSPRDFQSCSIRKGLGRPAFPPLIRLLLDARAAFVAWL